MAVTFGNTLVMANRLCGGDSDGQSLTQPALAVLMLVGLAQLMAAFSTGWCQSSSGQKIGMDMLKCCHYKFH